MGRRSARPGGSASATFGVAAIVVVLLFPLWLAGGSSAGAPSPDRSIAAAPSAVGGQEWPTYLGNPARTSSTDLPNGLTVADAHQLGVNWSFATGGPVVASTTVMGGTAYFGSWDGDEYAVNVSTGRLLWTTYLGVDSYDPGCATYGITSAATVANGVLYVGGNNATGGLNATWYAINASTGAILWGVPIGSMAAGYYNWASPLVYDGYAYIGVASDCDHPLVPAGLVQLNLTTHRIANFFHTTPFNTTTGSYDLGASIWSSPSVDSATGTVFASTGNQPDGWALSTEPYADAILALNATNVSRDEQGQPGPEAAWQLPAKEARVDGDFGAGPTVLAGAGAGGQDLIVAGDKNGYEYALNATDLATWEVAAHHLGTLWQIDTDLTEVELLSPAAYGGGLVYFGTPSLKIGGADHRGSIWAVSPRTGKVAWKDPLPGPVIGAPLYVDGVLVVVAGSYLYLLDAANGHRLNHWEYSGAFVDAPSVAEGRIFEGNENDVVDALCVPSAACMTAVQP